jgi:low affinity Fe/Cu permease
MSTGAPAVVQAHGTAPDSGPRRPRPAAELFRVFAARASQHLGTPWAFCTALFVIVAWLVSGPLFGFSDAWQLVINTGTTIVTFLMVFLVQATQNRDARAIHLKLDELIRTSRARNLFADLEDATDEELDELQREFQHLRKRGLKGGQAVREAKRRVWSRPPPDERG